MKVPKETTWIKFNKDQVGYYRVNYPVDDWKKLSEALTEKIDNFSIADRANLLNDAFSLAEATQISYEVPLELTKYLAKETQNVPWSVASAKLSGIRKLLFQIGNDGKFLVSWVFRTVTVDNRNANFMVSLQEYTRKIVETPYKSVGWTVGNDLNQK